MNHHLVNNVNSVELVNGMGTFAQSIRKDKIACIGGGYVGGSTMSVLADMCPHLKVYVLDADKNKIDAWNSDKLPICEPGLFEVVKRCRGINLFFTHDIYKYIDLCDIIFICVGTPTKQFGASAGYATDLRAWELAALSIFANSSGSKIIIEKSTVPVKSSEELMSLIAAQNLPYEYCVLSNPEFLAEGTAVKDLLKPARVLIGGPETSIGKYSIDILTDIYAHWVDRSKIILLNSCSSELSKLASNAFLAQRISSINAISMVCESVGADVLDISRAVGMDSRIGSKYLQPSVGFGGSCFEKDLLSLIYLCKQNCLEEVADYWEQVLRMNILQKQRFSQTVVKSFWNNMEGKRLAIFGFAFKKNTADVRRSAAVDVCRDLIMEKAILQVYDPEVTMQSAVMEMQELCNFNDKTLMNHFFMMKDAHSAVKGSSAILILTDWEQFVDYDYSEFYKIMRKPAFIFDGRNLLNRHDIWRIGFEVYSIGRPPLSHLNGLQVKCPNDYHDQ
ncbi:putative UDP-glucose 6-dehydrogenase 1 [Cardiosporidium cionae]|uniref:UDP-glucose 6-dehydrogenase n=1 Tax=Cardiosporidium cionae TaxID=476202 RepID=A0ABQ7J448_9APIC|nr:putative UDP-glucose 6-dehydrogenase 1 [Cardiosporidium cionae]|eukprot:KAF8817897.1 putative UDP-glucose 6-dehydrogenase 1 [Cardiosporidium cionae]